MYSVCEFAEGLNGNAGQRAREVRRGVLQLRCVLFVLLVFLVVCCGVASMPTPYLIS